jgi:NADPH2:quinone reductase
MRAVQVQQTGGPEVLKLVELDDPAPGPGEILIRQQAIGLNFIDTYYRTGLYPMRLPAVLGVEGAGVVEAVGEGVTRFAPGDRAGYAMGFGAYSDLRTYPADRAVKLPDGVSTRIAAASLLKGMTAEFLLRRCYEVKPGDPILVHAAAGGVGMILSQWGKALGALVIGTAGSEEKAQVARAHGCDDVILYREENVAERVKAITGGAGVRVVYDGVGADTFEASLASLGRRGVLITYGNASGPAPAIAPLKLMRGSLYLTRPTLFDYISTTQELDESAAALFQVLESGAVKVEVGQEFPLAEARRAHEALEGRQTVGSTLLIP